MQQDMSILCVSSANVIYVLLAKGGRMGLLPEQDIVSEKAKTDTPKCGGLCQLINESHITEAKDKGKYKYPVLFVIESPQSLELIESLIDNAGFDLDDGLLSYAVRCRPLHNEPPELKQIQCCRIFMKRLIEKRNPVIIIPFGGPACRSVIGMELSDVEKLRPGAIDNWAGWQIPSRTYNAWICPTYDPKYYLQTEDQALKTLINQHLTKALKLGKRPYEENPNEIERVEILSEKEALLKMKDIIREGEVFAFDYETTGLKPEADYQKIVSCSVASWEYCYAWTTKDDGMKAVRRLVKSKNPKIASNAKFEERWTIARLGTSVRNWHWDTMLAGHVINNRSLTSIKFLSYAMFGHLPYDEHIEKYLKSEYSNGMNTIHKLRTEDLLLYNGLDSILEFNVAMKQMKIIGYPLGDME